MRMQAKRKVAFGICWLVQFHREIRKILIVSNLSRFKPQQTTVQLDGSLVVARAPSQRGPACQTDGVCRIDLEGSRIHSFRLRELAFA